MIGTKPNQDWIHDGILYSEYVERMDLEMMLARETAAVAMLDEAKITVCPLILILTNVTKAGFTIKLSDYSKILLQAGFMTRICGIWTVGAPEEIKSLTLPIVAQFFGKRFRFVDSIEEAEAEAKKCIPLARPLLE